MQFASSAEPVKLSISDSLNLYGCTGRAKNYPYLQGPTHFRVGSIVSISWEISISKGDKR